MQAKAVQMNIRIPNDVKQRGNEAFASIGVTPTEAVRALWEKAADRGEGLSQINKLLFCGNSFEAKKPSLPGPSIAEGELSSQGIFLSAKTYTPISDAELIELALEDRYSSRGLL